MLDLVITDFSMPEMNGIEFINCASSISPDMKFIVISGLIDDAMKASVALSQEVCQRVEFLPKPSPFETFKRIVEYSMKKL